MLPAFIIIRGQGAFRFVKSMSKAAQRFSPDVLATAAEAAFDKFRSGTFGSVSFALNYAPPVSTQEKLLRDILVLELCQIKGWRHGRGFGEKDVVNKEDAQASALLIVSADPVGFRQERKDYRIRRKVNASGYYIAVNFEPILIIDDKIRQPRLAQVRHGLLKITRTPNQTNQNLIAVKFNDLRQLKLAQGPYLYNTPVSILKGIGRAGVRALEEKQVKTLGDLLDKQVFAHAQEMLNPQSLADLNKYLDYLKTAPKPAEKQTPPVPPTPQFKIELKKSKLAAPAPIVSNPQANELVDETKVLKKGDKKYASAEEADLDIPLPPPPKAKQVAKVEVSDLVFFDDKYLNNPDYQYILIECEGCGGVIKMPVPKAVVLNSPLPVVPVTYVHGKDSRHALLAHLDHDFQVRRVRFSHLVEAGP
jgi:hypothetical protein